MLKQCSKCKIDKPVTEFRFRNKQKQILQTQCKECCKRDGKAHYQRNQEQQIAKQLVRNEQHRKDYVALKQTLKCCYCPETFYACLEFHHVDAKQKDFNPSDLHSYTANALVRELNKCVCVCANCHRKIHKGLIKVQKQDKLCLNASVVKGISSLSSKQ